MKLRNRVALQSFLGVLLFSGSVFSKVWIPNGTYINQDIGFKLEVDFKRKHVSIGSNICYVSGKLTQPNKSKGIFLVKHIDTDGIICPHIKTLTITALDGLNLDTRNGARTVKVSHQIDNSGIEYEPYSHRERANFNGYYIYSIDSF